MARVFEEPVLVVVLVVTVVLHVAAYFGVRALLRAPPPDAPGPSA